MDLSEFGLIGNIILDQWIPVQKLKNTFCGGLHTMISKILNQISTISSSLQDGKDHTKNGMIKHKFVEMISYRATMNDSNLNII